jgi:hypothetical protein
MSTLTSERDMRGQKQYYSVREPRVNTILAQTQYLTGAMVSSSDRQSEQPHWPAQRPSEQHMGGENGSLKYVETVSASQGCSASRSRPRHTSIVRGVSTNSVENEKGVQFLFPSAKYGNVSFASRMRDKLGAHLGVVLEFLYCCWG